MSEELEAASSPDAFEAFFTTAWPKLVGFASSITRDVEAAEEVAQEALARTYARFRLVRNPLAFALRVTRNLAIDHVRRRAREVPTSAVPEPVTPAVPDSPLMERVLALPEDLRDIVLLHYFVDLPVSEVAAVVRRPEGTVKRRLSDARRLLADALGETDER